MLEAQADKVGFRKVKSADFRQDFDKAYVAYKKAALISILGDGKEVSYTYNRITTEVENIGIVIDTYEGKDKTKSFSEYSTVNMYLATLEGVQDHMEKSGHEYTPRSAGFYVSTSLHTISYGLKELLKRNASKREKQNT